MVVRHHRHLLLYTTFTHTHTHTARTVHLSTHKQLATHCLHSLTAEYLNWELDISPRDVFPEHFPLGRFPFPFSLPERHLILTAEASVDPDEIRQA